MANPKLEVELGLKISDFERNLAKATQDLDKFSGKLQATGKKFKSAGSALTKGLTAPLAILGGLAVKTAADFETLNTALITTFQGNKVAAKAAFDQIIEFASKTPFQVEQVANAFIKLKNFGLDPSARALTAYGDTASAMGKSLDQMIEAVADAATGEMERLKEFGIRASKQGEDITFTFRGVSKTVKNESEAIQGYLINLGETDFAGGMAAQSETFSGKMSTLRDNISLLANDIGTILIEMINPWMEKFTELVGRFKKLDDATKRTIVNIGLLTAAIGPLLIATGFILTSVLPGLITAFGFLSTTVIPAVIAGFKTLYATMLANPIVLVIAGLALITNAFLGFLQTITPAVSKLQTFFNIIASGGSIAAFSALQIADQIKATEELGWAAEDAAFLTKEFEAEQAALALALKNANDELDRQAKALAKSQERSAASNDVEKVSPSGVIPIDLEQADVVIEKYKQIETEMSDATLRMIESLNRFNEQATFLINGALADAFVGLGEMIGNSLSGAAGGLKNFGSTLLGMMGTLLSQLGQMAIELGIGLLAIDLALKTANPYLAIAAGIALVALGAIFSNTTKKSSVSGGAGGATGGAGGAGSGDFGFNTQRTEVQGGQFGNVTFEIQGTQLIGVMNNSNNQDLAMGGGGLGLNNGT